MMKFEQHIDTILNMDTWRQLTPEEKRYISRMAGLRYNFSYKKLREQTKRGIYGKKYIIAVLLKMLRDK